MWELIFIVSPKLREPIRKILETQCQLSSMWHEGLFRGFAVKRRPSFQCGSTNFCYNLLLQSSLISLSLDFLIQKIELPEEIRSIDKMVLCPERVMLFYVVAINQHVYKIR